MRSTVVGRQASFKRVGAETSFVADPGSGAAVAAGGGGRGGVALVDPAHREAAFAAAAERATRLLLLSAVGAVEDDLGTGAEAGRTEASILLDLALRPAASDREYDLKRSLVAGFASRRDDNLRVMLDAAVDADAARLRERVRPRRPREAFAGAAR